MSKFMLCILCSFVLCGSTSDLKEGFSTPFHREVALGNPIVFTGVWRIGFDEGE